MHAPNPFSIWRNDFRQILKRFSQLNIVLLKPRNKRKGKSFSLKSIATQTVGYDKYETKWVNDIVVAHRIKIKISINNYHVKIIESAIELYGWSWIYAIILDKLVRLVFLFLDFPYFPRWATSICNCTHPWCTLNERMLSMHAVCSYSYINR